jgi:hypothetical protein
VSHANATLTRLARLRLARLVVEGGWSYCAAAKMFVVSPRTAKKGADRYRVDYRPVCVIAALDPTAVRPRPGRPWFAASCGCGGAAD